MNKEQFLNEAFNINENEPLDPVNILDDYFRDVYYGAGWVTLNKIDFDRDYYEGLKDISDDTIIEFVSPASKSSLSFGSSMLGIVKVLVLTGKGFFLPGKALFLSRKILFMGRVILFLPYNVRVTFASVPALSASPV